MNEETLNLWNEEIKRASVDQIIDFAFANLDKPIAVATSLSVEDQWLTHLICSRGHQAHFFTLDTGRLPQETYDTIAATEKRYGISIRIMFPEQSAVENMVNEHGVNLFYDSIEKRKLCCNIRKTQPLMRALEGMKAWMTGLRREQSVTRYTMPVFDLDVHTGLVKVNPLADMLEHEVWDAIESEKVPFNPLQKQGYRSLGCLPCTRPVSNDDDFRAGRWWWEQPESKECGLHKK